jgi:hypothetical protein
LGTTLELALSLALKDWTLDATYQNKKKGACYSGCLHDARNIPGTDVCKTIFCFGSTFCHATQQMQESLLLMSFRTSSSSSSSFCFLFFWPDVTSHHTMCANIINRYKRTDKPPRARVCLSPYETGCAKMLQTSLNKN